MSTCLIATFKNEAPFLLEWVSHHLSIGFDTIIIATNDCDDGTDAMLDALQDAGFVHHIANPGPYDVSIQADAYSKARKSLAAKASDWLMCLDADEFLNVHQGAGTVQDLIAAADPTAEAILVNWRLFGDNGRAGFVDLPLTEAFTGAQSDQTKRWPVKTLFRDDPRYLELRPHAPWSNPAKITVADKKIYTAAGLKQPANTFNLDKPFRATRWAHRSWKAAQVNHYACKTRELFAEKISKGTAWPNKFSKQRLSFDFFEKSNLNDQNDTSILKTRDKRLAVEGEMMKIAQAAKIHKESRLALADRIAAMPIDG